VDALITEFANDTFAVQGGAGHRRQ
jgi:hypothetical protein